MVSASARGCCKARVPSALQRSQHKLLVDVRVKRGCKTVVQCRCGVHLAALAVCGTLGFCAGLVGTAPDMQVLLYGCTDTGSMLGLELGRSSMLQARWPLRLACVVTWHGRVLAALCVIAR